MGTFGALHVQITKVSPKDLHTSLISVSVIYGALDWDSSKIIWSNWLIFWMGKPRKGAPWWWPKSLIWRQNSSFMPFNWKTHTHFSPSKSQELPTRSEWRKLASLGCDRVKRQSYALTGQPQLCAVCCHAGIWAQCFQVFCSLESSSRSYFFRKKSWVLNVVNLFEF